MASQKRVVRSNAKSVEFPGLLGSVACLCLIQTPLLAMDWETQTPPPNAGNMLTGVWGSGPNDVFAVGLNFPFAVGASLSGKILHYDGASWSLMLDVPDAFLFGVWGSGPNDVFAVGKAVVIDSNWISPPLFTSGDEILGESEPLDPNWAPGGLILHYDGSSWTRMDSGTSVALNGVWGTGPNDVYAVGGYSSPSMEGQPDDVLGVVLHYDGSSWSEMWSGTTACLKALWAGGPNDIHAVGGISYHQSSVLHYDGSDWSVLWTGSGGGIKGVWGTGPSNVFAVGSTIALYYSGLLLRYDGLQWSPISVAAGEGLNGIWGSGPNDIFAVGEDGTVLHYDGVPSAWEGPPSWRSMSTGTTDSLNAVWGSGPMDVFAVGGHFPQATPRPPYDNGAVTILHYGRFFTLSIETIHPEWGQITCNTIPSLPNPPRYGPGTPVTLTATPIQGMGFGGWEVYDPNYPGDANHAAFDANNPVRIVMNADRQVRATFGPYCRLDVSKRGGEWNSVTAEPNVSLYPPNTRVTLTAAPAVHQFGDYRLVIYDPNHPGDANYAEFGSPGPIATRFRHWELYDPCHPNDPNYVTIDTNNPTTIIMNADRQVTAVFSCGLGAGLALLPAMVGVCALGFAARHRRRRQL